MFQFVKPHQNAIMIQAQDIKFLIELRRIYFVLFIALQWNGPNMLLWAPSKDAATQGYKSFFLRTS